MFDYNHIIKEKSEDTDFDGKKINYRTETFFDLIKDVMAMANADIEKERHIVIGISLNQGESRLQGINTNDFQDPSIYQELIHENIEPPIDLRCFLYECEGKQFGIFEIANCNDPPYLMRKEYQRKQDISAKNKNEVLQKGEAWIRRNSNQTRMIRSDFDRIYDRKFKNSGFKGELKLYFSNTETDTLQLFPIDEMLLPSKRDYELLSEIIEDRRRKINDKNQVYQLLTFVRSFLLRIFDPQKGKYIMKDIDTLLEIQENMKNNFSDYDYFEIFSVRSQGTNVIIENLGNEYLEDVTVKFIIHRVEGIAIQDQEPDYSRHRKILTQLPNPFDYYMKDLFDYPNTVYHYSKIEIPVKVGTVQHGIPKEVFPNPIRIALNKSMAGKTIFITCIIYGKNLRTAQYKQLKILGLTQ
jgi:hypothetical protein